MSHATRYQHLVDTLSAMRCRGSGLDCSYHAALYLMASHPDLSEMAERYFSPEGIDFSKLMKKEAFHYDWMKVVADAAHNLFSWNSKCAATPFELSRLPPPYTQMVCNALFIANGDYEVQVNKNEQGQDALVLDDTALRKKEAFMLRFEELTASVGLEP